MKMRILGLALSLSAAFGLMACGDSSSGDDTPSCRVTSDANSVTMTMSYKGQSMVTTSSFQGENIVITAVYNGFSTAEFEEECGYMKQSFGGTGTCEDKKYSATFSNARGSVEEARDTFERLCKDFENSNFDDYDDEDDF